MLNKHLASYVPALIANRLANEPALPAQPWLQSFPAAALYADISGFSALTAQLTERGSAGLEELVGVLNDYLGKLIALVQTHGGDVLKFAGDAIVALWYAGAEAELLSRLACRAAQCGLELQQQAGRAGALRLRVSLGAGPVEVVCVGGVAGHWEVIPAGPPFSQIRAADALAQPGEVMLSPEIWELLHGTAEGNQRAGGHRQLQTIRSPLPPRPLPAAQLPPQAVVALCGYLSPVVLSRLEAGQSAWLAEYRRVSVLFLNLPDVPPSLEAAQLLLRELQLILARREGVLMRLGVDDSGVNGLIVFGLPSFSHADDAARCVKTGLEIRARLSELGAYRSAIGIATGRAFCGEVGSALRREYTAHGETVNFAYHLMQAAPDTILCEAQTWQAAQSLTAFADPALATVKGKIGPVPVYRPLRPLAARAKYGLPAGEPQPRRAIAGRAAERRQLAAWLAPPAAGVAAESSAMMIIEGEAGIGKSWLAEDLIEQATAIGMETLVGSGDATESSTPYYAWRQIFEQWFDLSACPEPEARRRRVLEQLAQTGGPALAERAPLLNAILPLGLLENDLTAQMTAEVRADNLRDLLARLLQPPAGKKLLLVLEDAHWLDSASWTMVARLRRASGMRAMRLLIVTRPLAEYEIETQPLNSAEVARLQLRELSAEDTATLVGTRLGVKAVTPSAADFIYRHTGGHPLFTTELAYALRDSNLIRINGDCRLAPDVELRAVGLPATVEGLITSRVDRLTPAQQLALKAASVLGHDFSLEALSAIHPVEADRPRLPEYFAAFEQLDFTAAARAGDANYTFKHAIVREVVYNLIPPTQRRQLHRRAAEWYEQTEGRESPALYPRLAYHYHEAGDEAREARFSAAAGEAALKAGAHREAVAWLKRALDLHETLGVSSGETAAWLAGLGRAYRGLGQLETGQGYLEQAAALWDRPLPKTRMQIVSAILREIAGQVGHRLFPPLGLGRDSLARRAAIFRVLEVYRDLGVHYYLRNDRGPLLYLVLRSLNIAELAGPSLELIMAYSNFAAVAGFSGWHRLASFYQRLTHRFRSGPNHLAAMSNFALYQLGIGRWAPARAIFKESLEVCRQIGDWNRLGELMSLSASLEYCQGNFAAAEQLYCQLGDVATRRGYEVQQGWAIDGRGSCALRLGRLDEAASLFEQASTMLANREERIIAISVAGSLAAVYWRQGRLELAYPAAEAAARLIGQIPGVSLGYYVREGYLGAAEVFLGLWEEGSSDIQAQARWVCRSLHAFARQFPIGQPSAWQYQGLYDWLDGKPDRARRAWRKSLALARKLEMKYTEGQAHYEIGRHAAAGPERRFHLERAAEIFGQLGAAYDLALAKSALRLDRTGTQTPAPTDRRGVNADFNPDKHG